MATRKKRGKKRKAKIKFKQTVRVVPKDSVKRDTLPKMEARPPADVAPVFRVKIRKK